MHSVGMEEHLDGTSEKLTAIGTIVAVFLIGCLSLYLMSNLSAEKKKQHLEELVSQLIHSLIQKVYDENAIE
ncbi:hypothetical protein [Gracilibacillus alcaliphilus]|uniref:hypothetical protein n=1 Tax=Gracilibacillus alcaliphilus TaxID=1401441 RepID=UPI00195B2E7B|nr:hypothetical protein [Gracilibacillus alcaliphilus]MBM7676885.1 adenosyl cobinamide kinase/adenosyl cobinamide phosphate guanylyltransferase [Gracilibacillus alcaliphilus]